VDAWASLVTRWRTLPPRVRTLAAGAAALCIAAAIAVSIAVQRPHATLFADALHPEQLAEVEERLAAWNVPFTPTADNVVVDGARRNDVLLRLSLAGVPHAHIAASGEALANVGALTPQAVVDAQTRSGLAGDIELGLRGIAGVDDAQVIVAPAKAAEFADDTADGASASVRLHLHDGATLSDDAVNGIRQYVAAGVAGLDPARVTIVDDSGAALGGAAHGNDAGGLQASLQTALDQAFGAGATIVRVRAERDARSEEVHDVRRSPLPAIAVIGSDESYDGDGKSYRRSQRSEDRGSDTHDVASTLPAGRVARISAAVFVDEQRGLDVAKIRSLAAATVGIDARRGDTLSVEAISFAQQRPAVKDGWWLAYGALVPLLPTIALVIGGLCALKFLVPQIGAGLRAIFERASIAQTRRAVHGFAPSQVAGALRDEPPHAAAAIISALPAATAAAVLDMYPAHERAAIVKRMQRAHSPLIPTIEEFIERA
jgi:flagellar M-ring protein FliF